MTVIMPEWAAQFSQVMLTHGQILLGMMDRRGQWQQHSPLKYGRRKEPQILAHQL